MDVLDVVGGGGIFFTAARAFSAQAESKGLQTIRQKWTSWTSVGVSGSLVWSEGVCLTGCTCLVLGSWGWVSRANTLSTWRATNSAAAAGVRVRVHNSLIVMRTRNPRAAAVIHATAIRDGGTSRNSVSVNNQMYSLIFHITMYITSINLSNRDREIFIYICKNE